MKHLLLTIIAAVVLVGCGESQQSVPQTEAKPAEPVAETAKPEPPTVKAPDISIHKAANKGDIETVKQYLDAGMDVNAKYKGRTLLHAAAGRGREVIVELLIDNGANVNVKDALAATPLHEAANIGDNELVELLIAKGADVNANDIYGSTPLHKAAHRGRKAVVTLFISKGADVNAINRESRTALDLAEKVEVYHHSSKIKAAKKETADLLRKHGAKTAEELKAEGK